MNVVQPSRLFKGDLVGICSPSGTIAHKMEKFERARKNFEKITGLRTFVAYNATKKHYYSAGTPEERVQDLHELFSNPEVKAILFSAGGDTAIDLLPLLDFELIKNNPKIIAGISDATTLLNPITAKTGLVTFCGFEFLDFADRELPYTVASINHQWFEGGMGEVYANPNWKEFDGILTAYKGWNSIRPGTVEGSLVGGNLQSFLQLVGTEYELSLPNQILCLEAYKLPKKQIRKALIQMKLREVFTHTSGLIIGYNLESDNPDVVGNEQPIQQTVLEVLGEYDIPMMQVGEIGHHVENFLQPIGARILMDATTLTLRLQESVTL